MSEPPSTTMQRAWRNASRTLRAAAYGEGNLLEDLKVGAGAVAAATVLSLVVERFVSESDIIMVYVVAVTLAAHRLRLRPSLLTALVSVLCFNFFFAHPRLTLYVHDTRYLLTFIALGGTGALISSLAAQAREQAKQSRELYRLTRRLAACGTAAEVAEVAVQQLHRLAETAVSVRLLEGSLALSASSGAPPSGRVEEAAAQACAEGVAPVGLGRGPVEGAAARYLPLVREGRVLGVLGVEAGDAARADELQGAPMLATAIDLISEVLDRLRLEAHAHEARLAVEAEQVRNTLLSSVSHDLRTPLATVTGVATTLLDGRARLDDSRRRELLVRLTEEAGRLERLVDNVLHMTRLDGSGLQPSLDWHVPHEVVGTAIARLGPRAADGLITVQAPAEPLLTCMDALLVEQAVANLLENALVHAPGSPVEVRVASEGEEVRIEVGDRGPGLGGDDPSGLFDKFTRGRAAGPGGAGLGLAICRAIARVHGGSVLARNRAGSGAVFGIVLPRGGPQRLAAPEAFELAPAEVAP